MQFCVWIGAFVILPRLELALRQPALAKWVRGASLMIRVGGSRPQVGHGTEHSGQRVLPLLKSGLLGTQQHPKP